MDQTVWLTQGQMAALFGKTVANINIHIKNIYKEGELRESPTIKEFLIVQKGPKVYRYPGEETLKAFQQPAAARN